MSVDVNNSGSMSLSSGETDEVSLSSEDMSVVCWCASGLEYL